MFYPRFIPAWLQRMIPGILWKGEGGEKEVHLTFDDGPIPEVTPWVLDMLKKYDQKATFFCVGDNVRKYPEIFGRITSEGHGVGNHTFHHLNGWYTDNKKYMADVESAGEYIQSDLFRPPYGKMKVKQYFTLKKQHRVVMWTYLSGDFDKTFNADTCIREVKKVSKAGAILVFHDNVKTKDNVEKVLPEILDFYKKEKIRSVPVR